MDDRKSLKNTNINVTTTTDNNRPLSAYDNLSTTPLINSQQQLPLIISPTNNQITPSNMLTTTTPSSSYSSQRSNLTGINSSNNNKNINNKNINKFDRKSLDQNSRNEPITSKSFKFDDLSPTTSTGTQLPTNPYENVADVINMRNLKKSVISDAKSSFFGLENTNSNNNNNTNSNTFNNKNSNINNSINKNNVPNLSVHQSLDNTDHFSANKTDKIQDSNSDNNLNCDNIDNNTNNNNNNSNNNINNNNNNKSENNIYKISNFPDQRTTPNKQNVTDEQHTPSQAVYMKTTVPQNIKGSNIMGRHTPTRTSLRHSRMLVVNKNFQGRQSNSLDLKYPVLAKLFLICQIIIGLFVTCIGLWLIVWSPNTRTRDNPYWSGLMLMLSGTLGLVLIEFKLVPRHRLREYCFKFIKFNSYAVTFIAIIFSFIAFLFAAMHLLNLCANTTVCLPQNNLMITSTCICVFDVTRKTNHSHIKHIANSTLEYNQEIGVGGYEFHYRDLTCHEVTVYWKYILFASTLLNLLGFICVGIYTILLCFRIRTIQAFYKPVRTDQKT